jgi:hypothetical protein
MGQQKLTQSTSQTKIYFPGISSTGETMPIHTAVMLRMISTTLLMITKHTEYVKSVNNYLRQITDCK